MEKEKIGDIRKREIRNAAKKCFLRKGFQNTTMEDIVKETGMSKGGVYHHYSSTAEILKGLMLDGNNYRYEEVNKYLLKHTGGDKYEKMADILIIKSLDFTDLMKLYSSLLQMKSYNEELNSLYETLKAQTIEHFNSIVKQLGIESNIFADDFLVNYVNSLILSSELLKAREVFDSHKIYLKKVIIDYIKNLDS